MPKAEKRQSKFLVKGISEVQLHYRVSGIGPGLTETGANDYAGLLIIMSGL